MPQRAVTSPVSESDAQHEARRRVLTDYFPSWCAVKKARDASAFDPDWSFLTPGLAHWFLTAIDEQLVDVRNGSPTLPGASRTHFFGNDKPLFYREGVLEVAAVGMLVCRFGWSPEELRFQSPWPWAFDVLAYAGSGDSRSVAIAGEAKWKQADAIKVFRGIETCCERGRHTQDECTESINHHRKYEGLLEYRPRVLWVIGPNTFSDAPDLVFRVREAAGDTVQLEVVDATALAASSRSGG